jgi:hypothetical protein
MDQAEIIEAMRHGRRPGQAPRNSDDLGRFGLGLKTASLSQCRRLIVISLKDGRASGAAWDLDLVAARNDWILKVFDSEDDLGIYPHFDGLKALKHGTLVLWQELDLLVVGESSLEAALGRKMDSIRDHISLVFHRYLSGEHGIGKVEISLNSNRIEPLDPFLVSHPATQPLYSDTFEIAGALVSVHPYILPHASKLRADHLRLAGGEEGFRKSQGFYVYRNKRLIIHGTWFRLARTEELTKLARVRVDIPNTIDHLWLLDLKKSLVSPPEGVRQNLKRTVNRISERSRQTYVFRGNTSRRDGIVHMWNKLETRIGFQYLINREHMGVKLLSETLDTEQKTLLEGVLATIERTLPLDLLYVDLASERRPPQEAPEKETLLEFALNLLDTATSAGLDPRTVLQRLRFLEPFSLFPELTDQLIEEIQND